LLVSFERFLPAHTGTGIGVPDNRNNQIQLLPDFYILDHLALAKDILVCALAATMEQCP